jgi:uncharacterized membrane protein (UPF0127 family)
MFPVRTHQLRLRPGLALLAGAVGSLALGCSEAEPLAEPTRTDRADAVRRAVGPETVRVEIAGKAFALELAIDPRTRTRGLGGRRQIAHNGGMLFVNARAQHQAMVMRDCPIPIDVAFLDDTGLVVAIHSMQPEPPRGAAEAVGQYERRLPTYPSGVPVGFAVETAGGRLGELGLRVGDRMVFESRALLERARGRPRG